MECDRTGSPCDLRKVPFLPGNVLAWELYHQSRLEGIGGTILQLRQHELELLPPYEREQLAYKLEVIGATYAEIERDEIKAAKDKAEMERRKSGRS